MTNQISFFHRDVYVERIRPFMNTSLVKVMVGLRRVGKSFILYQLAEIIRETDPNANIIYINKEDVAFDDIKTYKELHDYVLSKSVEEGWNYIFIDEIQEISQFHLAIRSLALNPNNDIYITGSNSEIFSSDLAGELSGRYIEFNIHPLSYGEFLTFHALEDSEESLDKYLHFGGMPYLIHLPMREEIASEYLRNLYSTIVLKDIIQRKNIRNTTFLERLIRFLADSIGSIFSAKSISDFLKNQRVEISPYQVGEYVKTLADAFIIRRANRYDIVGKRQFEWGEKEYFEDLGLRNIISGYRATDRAKRLENAVYNHLIYCGYTVKVGVIENGEIDFYCTRNGETLYVQATLELSNQETIDREFGNLLKIRDNYPKLVVSRERSYENTHEGVQHVYIRDFLTSSLNFGIK